MAKKTMKTKVAKTTGRSRTAKAHQAEVEHIEPNAPRARDEFGFYEGTDSSITAHVLAEGGNSRPSLYAIIEERISEAAGGGDDSLTTRNGTRKNIPNLVATVVAAMKKRGYVIESTWRMVKDENFVEPETEIEEVEVEEEPEESKAKTTKKRRKVTRGSRL